MSNLHPKGIRSITSEQFSSCFFTVNGYRVCYPISHDAPYDFVVEKDNKLQRVQVKTINLKHCKSGYKKYTFPLCSSNKKKYDLGDFEILSAVLPEHNIIYNIPHKEVYANKVVTLYPFGIPEVVKSRNKNKEGWRDHFEYFNIFKFNQI